MEDLTTIRCSRIRTGNYYIDPNRQLSSDDIQEWPTDKQYRILKKFSNNQYFTDKEKNFIINYLIDCLVENQPFDCSSLGPNKYLNE